MKKIISIIFICLLCFCMVGCNEEETETNITIDTPINIESTELKKLVSVQDLGFIGGEYNRGLLLFKISNNNSKAVTVTINVEYFDSNGMKIDSSEVNVRVSSNRGAYGLIRMYEEKSPFSTYKYDFSVKSLENYDNIYSNVNVYYSNSNGKINIKTTNNSSRVTTATVFVIFYNSGKIVDVKDYKEYDVTSGNSKTGSVDYPMQTAKSKMSFNRVDVVLNEVTNEL